MGKREKQLRTRLPQEHSVSSKIRLTESDLKVVLTEGARMVEMFYPEAVLARMSNVPGGTLSEKDDLQNTNGTPADAAVIQFWAGHSLPENDWLGLASNLLTEVFSADFLTPLQEIDTAFALKVCHSQDV